MTVSCIPIPNLNNGYAIPFQFGDIGRSLESRPNSFGSPPLGTFALYTSFIDTTRLPEPTRSHHFFCRLAMAAAAPARIAGIATPFLSLSRRSQVRTLRCDNGVSVLVSKRLFSCSAIHNPQLHVKEQGQPETLDYRVFFHDSSDKKVLHSVYVRLLLCLLCLESLGK